MRFFNFGPHISTRHFTNSEYKAGLKWIQNYINIDIKPLTEKTQAVREKFYLNSKSAEIVTVSIKALCDSILGKKLWKYKLHQTRLRSEIMFQVPDSTVYELEIYHKPFSNDASMLIDLLNNPYEVKIADNMSCAVVHCYDEEIKAMVENILTGLCDELYNLQKQKFNKLQEDYKKIESSSKGFTTKTIEIAQNSIRTLYEASAQKNRSLVQRNLYSAMIINGKNVRIYHKNFLDDPKVLLNEFSRNAKN